MKNKINFLYILLILIAVFFRAYHCKNYGVGFDQVQIIESASLIKQGKLTLIGPRTGPASMFTGPLMYYLTAPFVVIFGEFTPIYFVPIFISVITGIVLTLLTKQYLTVKESCLYLLIWAVSPLIANLDRVLWNPNLTFLSSALLFLPLMGKKSNSNDKWTNAFLFSGAFLSYQAHFSGFVTVFFAVLAIIYQKRFVQLIKPIFFGFILSILPTVAFDFRHEFLNTNGLLNLLSGQGSDFKVQSLLMLFLNNFMTILKLTGEILCSGDLKILRYILGFAVILASFLSKKINKIGLWWLCGVALVYSFYSGEKPEYYFSILFPVMIYLFTRLIGNFHKYTLIFLVTFVISFSTIFLMESQDSRNGINVLNTEKIDLFLSNSELSINKINYDMPFGTEIGVKYYLDRHLDLVTGTQTAHIVYGEGIENTDHITWFNDVGIWIE